MPDGTLLSLPIPSDDKENSFSTLRYGDASYMEIIDQLKKNNKFHGNEQCHLDPDLRPELRVRQEGWKASFGQMEAPLTHLRNQGVGIGDLFLFFGLYRETEYHDGTLRYKPKSPYQHIIYGYMQVGDIIEQEEDVPSWLTAHPHASYHDSWAKNENAIYIASDHLSIIKGMNGAGVLPYRSDRVLTKPGMSRSRWSLPGFFKKVDISYHPNHWRDGYFQSVGRGQEFVMEMIPEIEDWVKKIITD
jgi:hypothetical protein